MTHTKNKKQKNKTKQNKTKQKNPKYCGIFKPTMTTFPITKLEMKVVTLEAGR